VAWSLACALADLAGGLHWRMPGIAVQRLTARFPRSRLLALGLGTRRRHRCRVAEAVIRPCGYDYISFGSPGPGPAWQGLVFRDDLYVWHPGADGAPGPIGELLEGFLVAPPPS